MRKTCAKLVNVRTALRWIKSRNVHTTTIPNYVAVRKVSIFTTLNTQVSSDLYTGFWQSNSIFESVKNTFVHILHTAYKKNHELNKGTN